MALIANQGLRLLGDLFGVTRGATITEVNLEQPLTPVIDVAAAIDAGRAKRRLFIKTIAATAAGVPNLVTVSFNTASDWTAIRSSDQGGSGTANLGGQLNYIIGATLFVELADVADFVNAQFLMAANSGGIHHGPIARWVAADLIDGFALPSTRVQWPFIPISHGGNFTTGFEMNVTANANITFMIDSLNVPVGLYGRAGLK